MWHSSSVGPPADPGKIDCILRGEADGVHVVSVHLDARQSIRRRPRRDPPAGRDRGVRSELAVLVVLADVDDGQPPDAGEVEALVEVRLIHRSVTEEGDGNCVVLAQLRCERRARGGGDRPAHDPEAADHSVFEVDHVHRAGASTAKAGLPSQQLCEQARRIGAACEEDAVAAVGCRDRVLGLERRADADRNGLLALVEVNRPLDLVREEEPLREVFEDPDLDHRLVAALEFGLGKGSGLC